MGVFQQPFHAAVLRQEFFCGFVANARQSGDIIYRITHHTQIINNLFGAFYLKFFLHFGDAPNFNAIAHTGRAIHKNILRNQLGKIFIWGNHINLKIFFFCLFGKSANNIICLKSF